MICIAVSGVVEAVCSPEFLLWMRAGAKAIVGLGDCGEGDVGCLHVRIGDLFSVYFPGVSLVPRSTPGCCGCDGFAIKRLEILFDNQKSHFRSGLSEAGKWTRR